MKVFILQFFKPDVASQDTPTVTDGLKRWSNQKETAVNAGFPDRVYTCTYKPDTPQ